jgi:hypothetical protein
MKQPTKAALRLRIARDVLRCLRWLAPTRRVYLRGLTLPGRSNLDRLGPLLPRQFRGCQVCALGACFISWLRLCGRRLSVAQVRALTALDIKRLLATVFTEQQLWDIEQAFEQFGLHRYWRAKLPKPVEVVRQLMRAIIDQGGRGRLELEAL